MVRNRKEENRLYYINNKDKFKNRKKEYNQTDKGKKIHKISKWKHYGLLSDNYDEIYYRWLNSTKCELCKCEYTKKNKKCLDHNHNNGLFRNILCNSCNTSSKLCKTPITNTSGHKNITITKYNTYKVNIIVNKIRYRNTFKTIEEALNFRDFLL